MHTIEMETDNVCLVVEVLFRFIPFGTDIIKQNERRWNKHQNKKKTLCFDCNCSLLTNHFAVVRVHTTSAHNNNRSFDQPPQPVYNNVHAYKYTHSTRDWAKEKHTKNDDKKFSPRLSNNCVLILPFLFRWLTVHSICLYLIHRMHKITKRLGT